MIPKYESLHNDFNQCLVKWESFWQNIPDMTSNPHGASTNFTVPKKTKIKAFLLFSLSQAKTTQKFDEWISKLRHHRLYRQHEMAYGTRDAPRLVDVTSPVDDMTPITSPVTPVLPLPTGKIRQLSSFFFFQIAFSARGPVA